MTVFWQELLENGNIFLWDNSTGEIIQKGDNSTGEIIQKVGQKEILVQFFSF